MAIRARLVAPPIEAKREWPWHSVMCASVSSSLLGSRDRRMEAQTYLSGGFRFRGSIERRPTGWTRFGKLADVQQPGRLKGVLVSREFGTPFLAATQVFNVRSWARKYLAINKIPDYKSYLVSEGMVLVTRSGSVGKAILAHAPHENVIISDDLLRVTARSQRDWGWIYAYLHTPHARAMTTGAQYGHMIKHLEVSHLNDLPIPLVEDKLAESFSRKASRIIKLRNDANRLSLEADSLFADAIGPIKPLSDESAFEVRLASMVTGRRRLEASYHSPQALAILRRIKKWDLASSLTKRIWWMTRFRRFYGDSGIPYLSADELFTVNPPENKRILVKPNDGHPEYFVKRGWIVMACSGQVYGLNGAAALMTKHHENVFFSHDLIRIINDPDKIRAGYLLVALTHRTHGRPLLIRAAYGTSIPHLDPGDVADFPVARIEDSLEARISNLAEAAAVARSDADALEREIASDASAVIDLFTGTRK